MTHQLYTRFIAAVAARDVRELIRKDADYGASWQRRGGPGAFMVMIRKGDRIDQQITTALADSKSRMEEGAAAEGYDIFSAIKNDTRPDGILDDIRDLRGYLLLIEAECVARGWIPGFDVTTPMLVPYGANIVEALNEGDRETGPGSKEDKAKALDILQAMVPAYPMATGLSHLMSLIVEDATDPERLAALGPEEAAVAHEENVALALELDQWATDHRATLTAEKNDLLARASQALREANVVQRDVTAEENLLALGEKIINLLSDDVRAEVFVDADTPGKYVETLLALPQGKLRYYLWHSMGPQAVVRGDLDKDAFEAGITPPTAAIAVEHASLVSKEVFTDLAVEAGASEVRSSLGKDAALRGEGYSRKSDDAHDPQQEGHDRGN